MAEIYEEYKSVITTLSICCTLDINIADIILDYIFMPNVHVNSKLIVEHVICTILCTSPQQFRKTRDDLYFANLSSYIRCYTIILATRICDWDIWYKCRKKNNLVAFEFYNVIITESIFNINIATIPLKANTIGATLYIYKLLDDYFDRITYNNKSKKVIV